jgi:NitT/TauT family transport system ATP-binding protein
MGSIEFRGVSKRFQRDRNHAYDALRDVDLAIGDGEIVAIVGPSGCGKTTLLNVAASLLEPTTGDVLVDGKPVSRPGRDRGVVFQQDAIFMWRTVQRNVEYGLELQGLPKRERAERAAHWLSVVGLERFAAFYPKELSGGMKKRCQIATVLANEPEVLLMDEPYGALDYPTKCQLQDELLRILAERPKTVLFVTHDIEEALYLADRIVAMRDGAISEIHPVPFERPRTADMRLSAEFAGAKSQLWELLAAPEPSLDAARPEYVATDGR